MFFFQNGIVHRDLKLENIVLDEHENIKVNYKILIKNIVQKTNLLIQWEYDMFTSERWVLFIQPPSWLGQ